MTRVVMISNDRYMRLARVAVQSLRKWGVRGPHEVAVYDVGLSQESRDWLTAHGCQIPRLGLKLPERWWAMEPRYVMLVSIVAAVRDAAGDAAPDDVVVFMGTDMVFRPCEDGEEPVIDAVARIAREHAGPVGTIDVHTFATADRHLYARRLEDAQSPEFWQRWFGADLTNRPTWNTGIVAGRASVLAELCGPWMELCLRWAHEPEFYDAFNGHAIEQFAWSVLMETGACGHPFQLPQEFNVTRPLWHWQPERILSARVLHLTGPIKPWQPGAALHPMTMEWMALEQYLQAEEAASP